MSDRLINILVTPNAFGTKAEQFLNSLLDIHDGLVRIISFKDPGVVNSVSKFTDIPIDRNELSDLMGMDLGQLPDFAMVFLPTNDELSIAHLTTDFKQDILVSVGPPIKFAGSKTIILNNKVDSDRITDTTKISMDTIDYSTIECIGPIDIYCTSNNGYFKVGIEISGNSWPDFTIHRNDYDASVDATIVRATNILATLLE